MDDFTFTNRAYDLLLSLKSDGIIRDPKPRVENVQDLRLMIDIIKNVYPLYANADNKTIINFIEDTFEVDIETIKFTKANQEEEQWRPVKIQEILPGTRLKIVESSYIWYHTFWTYNDTHRIIPTNQDPNDHRYSKAFMYIWDKAKEGKVFIKNTFTHRLGDIVSHIKDHNSIGIITNREMVFDFTNWYSIKWEKCNVIPRLQFYKEWQLINKTKLEAMPMKTKDIIQHTKWKKVRAVVEYKEFNLDEWINENIVDGKGQIKAFFEDIKDDRTKILTHFDTKKSNFGWVDKERICIVPKHMNVQESVEMYFRKHPDKLVRKVHGIRNYVIDHDKYKDIKIISTTIIEKTGGKVPAHNIVLTSHSHRDKEGNTFAKQVTTIEVPVSYSYDSTKKKQIPRLHKKKIVNDKMVCIKHFPTGVVSRNWKSEYEPLVEKNKDYGFVSKHEYRKYRTTISINIKANSIIEPKREKPIAQYTKIGGTEGIGNSPIIEGVVRKARRYHSTTKGSRLVKEQFVPVVIPEEKDNIRVTDNTWETPWKNQVIKIVNPARVILKRILTSVLPHKEIKLTDEIKANRLERSAIDKQKYVDKKGVKSLSELKKEFGSEERRNLKYSIVEKWSSIFDKLVILITQHKLFDKDDKLVATINNNSLSNMVNLVLSEEAKTHWSVDKIKDFIRYIRQTTHGVFSDKPIKIKKVKLPIEREVVKTATRIDYSKLKINPPEENKTIYAMVNTTEGQVEKVGIFKENNIYTITGELACPLSDVESWKYLKEDEYKDLIIDEGGGKTEVVVKSRRKDPEHLKKYFEREKQKTNKVRETLEKPRKIQKTRRTTKGRTPRKRS